MRQNCLAGVPQWIALRLSRPQLVLECGDATLEGTRGAVDRRQQCFAFGSQEVTPPNWPSRGPSCEVRLHRGADRVEGRKRGACRGQVAEPIRGVVDWPVSIRGECRLPYVPVSHAQEVLDGARQGVPIRRLERGLRIADGAKGQLAAGQRR